MRQENTAHSLVAFEIDADQIPSFLFIPLAPTQMSATLGTEGVRVSGVSLRFQIQEECA